MPRTNLGGVLVEGSLCELKGFEVGETIVKIALEVGVVGVPSFEDRENG